MQLIDFICICGVVARLMNSFLECLDILLSYSIYVLVLLILVLVLMYSDIYTYIILSLSDWKCISEYDITKIFYMFG